MRFLKNFSKKTQKYGFLLKENVLRHPKFLHFYVPILGHLDLPILGVNELFDLDGRVMLKGFGNGVFNSFIDFPLTLSDPNERFPASFKYLNYMADRHMHYGHVVPNVNLFLVSPIFIGLCYITGCSKTAIWSFFGEIFKNFFSNR
jgi:hypothetical protein